MSFPGGQVGGGEDLFVGVSAYAEGIREQIRFIGATDCNACIQGASGTGKLVVAKALSEVSGRDSFCRLAMNQVDDEFATSVLFGNTDDGFTGAKRERQGFFATAAGGTAFLDEFDDCTPLTQGKLLDAIEGEEVRGLGFDRGKRVKTRIIVGSQDSLKVLTAAGIIREDLFFRLYQEALVLEPLVRHLEDIPALVEALVAREAARLGIALPQLTTEALKKLFDYSWPGNVRELDSELCRGLRRARYYSRTDGPLIISAEFLLEDTGPANLPLLRQRGKYVDLPREKMLEELHLTGGQVRPAAARCGVSFTTFWRRCKEYQLLPVIEALRNGTAS